MEYNWEVIFCHRNGTLTDFDNYNKDEVSSVVVKHKDNIYDFFVKENQQLIFVKRWVKDLWTDRIKNIIYFVGVDGDVTYFDSKTGKVGRAVLKNGNYEVDTDID